MLPNGALVSLTVLSQQTHSLGPVKILRTCFAFTASQTRYSLSKVLKLDTFFAVGREQMSNICWDFETMTYCLLISLIELCELHWAQCERRGMQVCVMQDLNAGSSSQLSCSADPNFPTAQELSNWDRWIKTPYLENAPPPRPLHRHTHPPKIQ